MSASSGRPRRARLWRWTQRIGLGLLVLALLARVSLPLWLPRVLDAAVAGRGLSLRYDDLDLALWDGRLDLTRLVLAPRAPQAGGADDPAAPRPPALAAIDHVGLDLDLSALLGGRLRVHRAVVDGVALELERDASGAWNVEPYLAGAEPATEQDERPEARERDAPERAPLDFRPPLEIETVALHGLRLHLRDALAQPALDTVVTLDVAARDVGHRELPARVFVTSAARELLDALRIEATATTGERRLAVDARVELAGLSIGRLAPYLAWLGLEPVAEELDLDAHLAIDLAPRAGSELETTGELRVFDVRLGADLVEACALDQLVVQVGGASTARAELPLVELRGLRGRAARRADGVLRVAGLDLVGAPGAEAAPEPRREREPSSSSPFALEVGRVALEELAFVFDDAAVVPPAHLEAGLRAELRDLVLDPARPGVPLTLSLEARLAGAGDLALGGALVPTGPQIEAELTLTGSSLTLASLAPYLAGAGFEPTLAAGRLEGTARVQVRAGSDGTELGAGLVGLRLADGDAELAALDELTVTDARFSPRGDVRIGEVALRGLRLPAATDGAGVLHLVGLAAVPAPPAAASSAAPASEPSVPRAPRAGPPPRIELARLSFSDSDLSFRARHLAEPLDLALEGCELALEDLAFGGDPALHQPSPARLRLAAAIPGVAEGLELAGTVLSRPGELDLELELDLAGRGLSYKGLRGLLAELGCEPMPGSGALGGHLAASAKQRGEELRASARLAAASFTYGEEQIALDELALEDLVLRPDQVDLGRVRVIGPRARARRHADGSLEALGIRWLPTAGGDGPEVAAAGGSNAPSAPPPGAAPTAPSPAPVLTLGSFTLERTEIAWSDEAVEPAVEGVLALSATVSDLSTAAGAPPASFELAASFPAPLAGGLALGGTLRADPAALALDAKLGLDGLRLPALAGYLPEGVEPAVEEASLSARLACASSVAAEGGRSLRIALSDLALRGAGEAAPLLALEELSLEAPRLDPAARVFDVGALVSRGFELDVRRTPRGLELLGLALAAPAVGEPAPESATPAPAPDPSAEAPPAGDASAVAGVPVGPEVRLGRLDLGIAHLRFRDEVRGGEELDLALALSSPGPQVLCSPEAASLPPLELACLGAARPLVDTLEARLTVSPYAPEPELALRLLVDGVRGEALARVLPELAQGIDASELESGRLEANLGAVLRLSRRSPVDFDLARGFGAELALTDLAWRAAPDGEVLAGIERVDVDVRRVRPSTGDVHVAAVEVSGLRGRVRKSARGTHVGGVVLLPPPAAGAAPAPVAAAPAAPAGKPAPAGARGELRLDRLALHGLDFRLVDETTDPPLVLPVADLEVDVRGFTTRAFEEPRSVTFRVLVDAGTVELAERTGADDLLSGVLGSVAGVVAGEEDRFELEQRRVWDQLELQGRLRFAPALEGRARLDLAGLELPAFAGPAAAAGVEIGDGLVDTRLDLRFKGEQGLGVDLRSTMSYLSLSEPPSGPISSYLKLPAPLDTVLFLLRDESGQQTIPLRVDVGPDGVSLPAVAGAAGQALGQLVVDALSAAPLRLLGPLSGVVDALGLTPEAPTAETVAVPYLPGVLEPEEQALEPVRPLLAALRADPALRVVVQHELGRGDVESAERLANPPPEAGAELVARLADRKSALERERGEVAALTRAQYGIGLEDRAAAGTAALRRLDREVVAVEAALDGVLELARPGAERRRDQRTRAAALALAEERLARLRAALLAAGGRDLAERIEIRRPRFARPEDDAPGRITLTPRGPSGS